MSVLPQVHTPGTVRLGGGRCGTDAQDAVPFSMHSPDELVGLLMEFAEVTPEVPGRKVDVISRDRVSRASFARGYAPTIQPFPKASYVAPFADGRALNAYELGLASGILPPCSIMLVDVSSGHAFAEAEPGVMGTDLGLIWEDDYPDWDVNAKYELFVPVGEHTPCLKLRWVDVPRKLWLSLAVYHRVTTACLGFIRVDGVGRLSVTDRCVSACVCIDRRTLPDGWDIDLYVFRIAISARNLALPPGELCKVGTASSPSTAVAFSPPFAVAPRAPSARATERQVIHAALNHAYDAIHGPAHVLWSMLPAVHGDDAQLEHQEEAPASDP